MEGLIDLHQEYIDFGMIQLADWIYRGGGGSYCE